VVVAMSGGVDSSVTAAVLKDEGYEVIGVTMQIWPSDHQAGQADRFEGCCSLAAVEDARWVAHKLHIPYYVLNFRELFARKVIADFCEEYRCGRTPNPCIRCNQHIKFDALLTKARELDADYIATGHYARIEYDEARSRYLLRKGLDVQKDQSYVLYMMKQDQLAHTLMPLGKLTKDKVRQLARELGLKVATKPESQEICFIPDNNYGDFLKDQMPEAVRAGPIIHRDGRVLGQHDGIIFYTIGQRRGLGISTRRPLYVVAIDKSKNTVIVGEEKDLYGDQLIASDVNWVAVERVKRPTRIKAKIRYRHQEADALLTPLDHDRTHIRFENPQKAITPGQAVVFYDGDLVIGGGTILEAALSDEVSGEAIKRGE